MVQNNSKNPGCEKKEGQFGLNFVFDQSEAWLGTEMEGFASIYVVIMGDKL